ncbi:MAG: VOC family protein [Anaerolineae bacterium]
MQDLGEFFPCLNVQDLEKSVDFYQKLGFKMTGDHRQENWAVLQHNNMALCLYQGHIVENMINFRGGDVETIVKEASAAGLEFENPAAQESDGSWGAEIRDPDGNVIYFNTFQDERDQYVKTGKLIDY